MKRLKRGKDAIDESDAVRWIEFLLGLEPITTSPGLVPPLHVRESRELSNAGGCTPLSVAAKAGHFRCVLTLLKWGATVEGALMDLSGPCAQGHVMCLLECKAKALGQIRQHFCCAHYDEIIASSGDSAAAGERGGVDDRP